MFKSGSIRKKPKRICVSGNGYLYCKVNFSFTLLEETMMEEVKQKLYFTFFTLGVVMFILTVGTWITAYKIYEENNQFQTENLEVTAMLFELENLTTTLNYVGQKHLLAIKKGEKERHEAYLISVHDEIDELMEEIATILLEMDDKFFEQLHNRWELFCHFYHTAIVLSEQQKNMDSLVWFMKANSIFAEINVDYIDPLFENSYRFIMDHVEKQRENSRKFMFTQLFLVVITAICFIATLYYLRKIVMRSDTLNDRLKYLAYHDELTGLPNRRYLRKHVELAIRNNEKFALMYIDVDKFKEINDRFGHEVGDQVIVAFANRVDESLSEDDLLGRLGGDEFIIYIDKRREEEVKNIAEKIIRSFDIPFFINDSQFKLSTSIGIAFYPINGKDYKTLVRNADRALYRAKGKRCSYIIYDGC